MTDLAPYTITFVGAGPGAADHLTLGACRALQQAEVVIHDRLVGPEILALIPATTRLIDMGKQGFGPSTAQSAINEALIREARNGLRVVRLKGGDAGIFGRLDEEIEAIQSHNLTYNILPGLTAAAVAAAAIGQPLTSRGRNAVLRIVTGHDMDGFAEQDWRAIARPNAVTAIYMAKKSARFMQGRLMMHDAAPDTPVTLIENVSRADQRILPATLSTLHDAAAQLAGPAVILYGLHPRNSLALPALQEATA